MARWAAESAKRYLAATIAVGTVDQAMLAGLQVKHAHLRSSSLSRSLLVIDEVHASDHYMTEVQNQLLKVHLRRGGYAMLMSATLGATAWAKWMGRWTPGSRAAPPCNRRYGGVARWRLTASWILSGKRRSRWRRSRPWRRKTPLRAPSRQHAEARVCWSCATR
jgi:hypothetical protein